MEQNLPELKKILGQSLKGQGLILQYSDRPQSEQQMLWARYYSALIPDPGKTYIPGHGGLIFRIMAVIYPNDTRPLSKVKPRI